MVPVSILPDPIRGVSDAFRRLRAGRRKRNTMWEALEWHLRSIGAIGEDDSLNKRGFRLWRRRYGEQECRRIELAYHLTWSRARGPDA